VLDEIKTVGGAKAKAAGAVAKNKVDKLETQDDRIPRRVLY